MTPYEQFEANLSGASSFLKMYRELRALKQLGQRGALSAENQYLLWLPRAAVVSAMGALDQFCHQTLYVEIPKILNDGNSPISEALCELVLRVAPVKRAQDVRDQITLIRSKDGADQLATRIRERILRFESYQAPEKVHQALNRIGHEDIFEDVSHLWQGPNTTRDAITRRLTNYVKRRNQIAHEGDLDHQHNPRSVTPVYADTCVWFIESLVWRINGVVFGWEGHEP